jgi:putative addiction module killer protein
MTYTLRSTKQFSKWLNKMRDQASKQKVLARLERIKNGNFGDYKQISPNLFELRFFFGGGLRVYYTIRDSQVILLLIGGDKSSQSSDIEKARKMLDEME